MAASLQSMCQYWKTFNLPELQKELDSTATDLAAKQDQSDVSRKRLVEQSREFKKNTSEDVRKVVAPLLKSFQSEIDSLTKRSKSAEAAFLTVYKKLIDAPDPSPVLDQSATYHKRSQRADDLEVENQKLRETLAEYNHEFAEVKNQEVTIKQLRDRLKEFEERVEDQAASLARDKEKELQKQFSERERALADQGMNTARRLGEAERTVGTLQAALENTQSELFDIKSKYDEATHAKSAEMEMVVADAERANERALAAERQVEQLKQQLADAMQTVAGGNEGSSGKREGDVEQAMDILKRSSLEVELAAKEKEITQLVEDVRNLQTTLTKLRESTAAQVSQLEEEVTQKGRALAGLEHRLETQKDYEEMKHELSVMKSIEFSLPLEEGQSTSSATKGKSLEVLLLEKNKSLQAETTQLKVANTDLNGRYSKLQDQYTEAVHTIQEQKQLIAQLEEDLRSVNALSSMFRHPAEGEDGPVLGTGTESDVVAGLVGEISKDKTAESPVPVPNVAAAADSLLPIIQSQRERYRVRVQELDAQSMAQQQQIQLLQNETDKLRSDNVKLYEKIKFLQSFPTKPASSTSSTDIESRYSSQYEQRLDPFSKFNKQEKLRRYMNLKPYDKITLSMGKWIMKSKLARTIFFFYILILHVLIFLVLYKMAYNTACIREASLDWHAKFDEHMQQAHPGEHLNM